MLTMGYNSIPLAMISFMSLTVVFLTLYCGMYFVFSTHYDAYGAADPRSGFLFFILLVANIIYFCFWLYQLELEVLRFMHGWSEKYFYKITWGTITME